MLLVIVVAVVGGVYAITSWQRTRETSRLLTDVQSTNHGVATDAMISLRERVPSVASELINLMRHTDPNVRWRAANLLADASDARSRDALLAALTDDSPTVRMQAVLALGKRDVRDSADQIALIASSEFEDLAVRTAALQALRMLRTGTHLAEAIAIAGDRPPPPPAVDDEEVAEAEAEAEVEEAAEEAEEYSDDTVLLRQEALYTVAALGGTYRADTAERGPALDAADALVEGSDASIEHDSDVRRAACYALGDLASLVRNEQVHRRAVEALIAAMTDEVGDVRIAATQTLRLVPVPAEMSNDVNRALEDAVNDDHYWVRRAAEEAVRGG